MRLLLTILCFISLQAQGQALFHAHNKVSVAGCTMSGITDADACLFITAVESDGTVLSSAQKLNIQNNLVIPLKDSGLWAKMVALYPMEGATASTHRWNLMSPYDADTSYRLTYAGTLTHTASGMQGDGSTGYVDTHLPANFNGDNMHLAYWSAVYEATGGKTDIGSEWVSLRLWHTGSTSLMYDASTIGGSGRLFAPITSTPGLFLGSRTSSAYFYVQQNGVTVATSTGAPDHMAGVESLYINAYHQAGGGVLQHSPRTASAVSIGLPLTEAEGRALYNILNTYLTNK